MPRTIRPATVAFVLSVAFASSALAADTNHPTRGKDTGAPSAAQPAAAGPGQSKSSDESPQSTDKSASQGAKATSSAGKAKKKRTRHTSSSPASSAYGAGASGK